jgi:hypothetical protein
MDEAPNIPFGRHPYCQADHSASVQIGGCAYRRWSVVTDGEVGGRRGSVRSAAAACGLPARAGGTYVSARLGVGRG